jgi:DNA-binding transcriptional MerR regulator
MPTLFTIGEFSRVTHLTVKALRHYDDVGLLRPAEIDRATGYRLYATAQVPAAQAIRRFRELEMPLEDIRAILNADRPAVSDEVILRHLDQMRSKLEQTQLTIASLQDLLEGRNTVVPIEHRTLVGSFVLAIRDRVEWDETEAWLAQALEDLHRAVAGAELPVAGPDGALYTDEFFETHRGDVIAFIPVSGTPGRIGRAEALELPTRAYAITTHEGPFADIDRAYSALGTYVTERGIGDVGPVRENYIVSSVDKSDPSELRTEVCWPIRVD